MVDTTMTEPNTPKEWDASSDAARLRMTKEQINAHPIRTYQGRIHLIRRAEQIEPAVRQLEKETVLGFDTETRPTFRVGQSYPPAVLQLAGEQAAYIFQLRHCRLSQALCRLLANPQIIKAGVAWDRDVQELNKLAAFTPAGFVDVGELAKRAGCPNHGLRGLAALLLGFRVPKNSQTSNWAQATLTRPRTLGWGASCIRSCNCCCPEQRSKGRQVIDPRGKDSIVHAGNADGNPWSQAICAHSPSKKQRACCNGPVFRGIWEDQKESPAE
jgi:hypothetical protein